MESDTLKLLNAYSRAENTNSEPNAETDEIDDKKSADTEEVREIPGITTDSGIVQAFLRRDERAITAASMRYGRQCVSIAQRILQNREDSEQCVNDALLKVWESVPPNTPTELLPYLARIVKNLALNRLRSDNAEKRGSNMAAVFEELENFVSDSGSAEARFEESELQKEFNTFLGTLKPLHRKMFILRYWFCCDLSEIASRLRVSEGTAAVTLTRIRKKFKDHLRKRGYDI